MSTAPLGARWSAGVPDGGRWRAAVLAVLVAACAGPPVDLSVEQVRPSVQYRFQRWVDRSLHSIDERLALIADQADLERTGAAAPRGRQVQRLYDARAALAARLRQPPPDDRTGWQRYTADIDRHLRDLTRLTWFALANAP